MGIWSSPIYFLVAIVNFLLGWIAFSKGPRKSTVASFSLIAACAGLWNLSWALFVLTSKIIFIRISFIPSMLIAAIFALFALSLSGDKNLFKKQLLFILPGIVLSIFSFTPLVVREIIDIYPFGYIAIAGRLQSLCRMYGFLFVLFALFTLWKELKKRRGLEKTRLVYFFVGALFFSGIGIITNVFLPMRGDVAFTGIAPLFSFVWVAAVTYAIIRHHLLDIRLAITRAGIFLIVYALFLGLPFWLGAQTQQWFVATSTMLVLAIAGPIVHRALQRKADNILMAQQKRYQRALLKAGKGMLREHNLERLLTLIVRVVKRAVRVDFVAAFIDDKEGEFYNLAALRGIKDMPKKFTIPYSHPLVEAIKIHERKGPIGYEEISLGVKDLSGHAVHLLVPCYIEDSLLAFLILGEKEDHTLYTQDDIDVFKILSHQASLALENCLFVEETKETQARLFQAEKLASIGGMADGVAHQIKNRLNHFSIASGEAQFEIRDFIKQHKELVENNPDLQKTFAYLNKIAESLITNVKRTNGVIQGILNYARVEEKDTFFSEFSLKESIDVCLELLGIKHEVSDFPLEFEIDGSDVIYGVKAQLVEAFYNILDNCYEAIQDKMKHYMTDDECLAFKPLIHMILAQNGNYSIIGISDNGVGIKDEDKAKIFAPFFTTKSSYKSGSGIGMYVVKRMIEENHNGRITFKSEYMKGTRFVIELPRSKTKR